MLKIIEGVEFDENSKTVSFSKYEDIVDTSLFNNPSKKMSEFFQLLKLKNSATGLMYGQFSEERDLRP